MPQCAEGTPVDQCVHTTESYFTPRDSMRKCSSLSDVWCAPGWDENKDVMLLRAGVCTLLVHTHSCFDAASSVLSLVECDTAL